MNKLIIADPGPLIALSRVDQLFLLNKLFDSVLIPQQVAQECLSDLKKSGAAGINLAIKKHNIQITPQTKHNTLHLESTILGPGESVAIQLAHAMKSPLLIDDKLGRKIAKTLEIKIIGTAGILLLAKEHQIITQVKPILMNLKDTGYYFTNELINEILKQAQEQ